jgi:intracellular septation protein
MQVDAAPVHRDCHAANTDRWEHAALPRRIEALFSPGFEISPAHPIASGHPMKLLIDFLPILLFFVAYKLAGIYVATGVAIATSAVQLAWSWFYHHQIEKMQLVTLCILVVFGGMSIALQDPIFVMWKPTLVNWLFAAAFVGSQWIGQRTLIERMMGQAIELPTSVWTHLNRLWAAFFTFLGMANLLVVYVGSGFYTAQQALIQASGQPAIDLSTCATTFTGDILALCNAAQASEAVWVNFKLFGMMGLTIAFVIIQALYLSRHVKDDNPKTPETD